MSLLPGIQLKQIRQHESSQQRAWEELTYMLVADVEGLPPETVLERRAPPDGGVEFACAAPRGTGTWAWQAKFLDRLADSAWGQMERSFCAALDSTPDLARYAFLLPIDRTAKTEKSHGTLTKWNDHAKRWRSLAAERGMTVELAYIGESQVLKALTLAHHAGAVRYFFDETLFTPEFFKQQVAREVANLGERYDPDVHVGVDVEAVIDGACRTEAFAARIVNDVEEVDRAARALREAAEDNRLAGSEDLAAAIAIARDAAADAARTLKRVRGALTTPYPEPLRDLKAVLQACSARAQAAAEEASAAARALATTSAHPKAGRSDRKGAAVPEVGQRTARDALFDAAFQARKLQRAAGDAAGAFDDPAGEAAARGAVLLQGPAGCGKSHLLGGTATSRVASGLPTLLVLGQQLEQGPLWDQITRAIDRPELTGDDLLATLEVAARVRGGGRALLAIDAINESKDAIAWRDRLAGWLADIAQHPWIAVVVTIRDTYTAEVVQLLPPGSLVSVAHPGLAGHEEEALALYTQKYHLRLPDIPPLLPELTNPLFLRSLCRAARARGLDAIPREAHSPTWVFDGLLDAVNDTISDLRRLDVDPADRLAHRAVDALATAMLDQATEALPAADVRAICDALLPGRPYSNSLFQALVAEGILLRENLRSGDRDRIDRVRFTYQRLADHLRAHVLLARCPSDGELRAAVLGLAAREDHWALQGMFEALVLIVGETRGRELADIAGARPTKRAAAPRPHRIRRAEERARDALREALTRAFFATLPWRAPASIRDDTKDLIDAYLTTDAIDSDEWLRLLLSLACVPEHPLNARFLDNELRRMTMPERDEVWSVPIASGWWDDTGPITRTIDWAWSPTTRPGDDVSELASTLLAWLLTSTNRRIRDSATKALVRLFDDRTRLAADLVARFVDVDDPYVVERIIAVACGHALRRRHDPTTDHDALAALGETVYDAVFASDPTPPHVLLRHYARTTVEAIDDVLRRSGRALERDVATAVPPFQSPWPLNAPPLCDLEAHFDRSGSGDLTTATVLGLDFVNDTLDQGVSRDFVLPDQPRRLAVRRAAAKARETVKDPSARAAVDTTTADPGDPSKERAVDAALRAGVPAAAAGIPDRIDATTSRVAADEQPIRPDPGLLSRWIANRVLELGWTSDRFEPTDRALRQWSSLGSDAERVGKKYTWIAFHELLGHLADHCTLQERWSESAPEPYEDPWQLSQAPDLDPSVVIRGDEPPKDTPSARLREARLRRERVGAWWIAGYDRTVSKACDGAAWLDDVSDVPHIAPLLSVTDPLGGLWLVMESHATWRPADAATDPARADRHMWVRTQAQLIRRTDLPEFRTWAGRRNWMGLWMPTPTEHPTGFVGGYPDMHPWPKLAAAVDDERQSFDEKVPGDPPGWQRTSRHDAPDRPFALATASYTVYSDRDRSAVDLPRAILPAPALLDLLDATWTGGRNVSPELALEEIELDYSWHAGSRVVAFCSSGRDYGSTALLCVRADALLPALGVAGLAVWSWILGEKIYWRGGQPQADRAELYGAAEVGAPPTVWGRSIDHRRWVNDEEVRVTLEAE